MLYMSKKRDDEHAATLTLVCSSPKVDNYRNNSITGIYQSSSQKENRAGLLQPRGLEGQIRRKISCEGHEAMACLQQSLVVSSFGI